MTRPVVKPETLVIEIESLYDPFATTAKAQFESLLPDFIATRRWFRAKTRTIEEAEIEDVFAVPDGRSYILVVRLDYTDGNSDEYLLNVGLGVIRFGDGTLGKPVPGECEVIATFRSGDGAEGNIYDALGDPSFRQMLLDAIACDLRLNGERGDLQASCTAAFSRDRRAHLPCDSFLSRAEQSNTSIVYGDRYILKLFRKIEPGINPDLEIGTFLTERGFAHTPAVLGRLEYARRSEGRTYAAGILQAFVPNQGDAWKFTLESLDRFFARALAAGRQAPALVSYHPLELALELAGERISPGDREFFGEYLDSAHLLGQRTAEMHAALTDSEAGRDFAPEPFNSADGKSLYEEMLGQADIAFELLRRKQAVLTGPSAEDARAVLRIEHRITERFRPLRDHTIRAARIRLHGDYHLGQVLYTGTDFMIIDFEGEPARPLGERRAKGLAMRDVAGMVRSFQYAAYSALFRRVSEHAEDRDGARAIESWAAFWTAWASAAYVNGYFSTAGGRAFVSATPDEQRIVFDSFLLQKALYEVAYELNNRPDWVRIPLRGILNLVS